jgi:c-di-GMP-binding flagellar brake protein YcgR
MNVTELVTLGTKIDIRLMPQLKKQEERGERAPVYKSRVTDFPSENEMEITMPTLVGRMVLFQMGAECNLIFFTKSGMYTTTATVTKRYRKENIYFLNLYLTGSLVKFQRREYYRVSYFSDLKYRIINYSIAHCDSIQEVEFQIDQEKSQFPQKSARTLDVSGGGLRFSTEQQLEERSFLYMQFSLTNGIMDEEFYQVGQVISSDKHPKEPKLFINRLQFLFKDLRDREKIVRFVFEEERRMRNKGADELK